MKIALHGYGKMGRTIDRLASESGHEIVAIFESGNRPPLNGAAVLIDFSKAGAVDGAVDLAVENRIPLVIGTTGWQSRLDAVGIRIREGGIGCVWAANFSPGANAVFVLARRAGEILGRLPQYAAGLEERHHAHKKDAPSGTATYIAGEVEAGSGGKLTPPIVASRVGSEFGLHTLFFDSPDDVIEITHRARNRDGFARGAILAAELVRGRTGLFRFDELI